MQSDGERFINAIFISRNLVNSSVFQWLKLYQRQSRKVLTTKFNLPIFSINSAASSASLWIKVFRKSLHGGIDAPYLLGSNATTVNLLERPFRCGPKSDPVDLIAPGRQSMTYGELPETLNRKMFNFQRRPFHRKLKIVISMTDISSAGSQIEIFKDRGLIHNKVHTDIILLKV